MIDATRLANAAASTRVAPIARAHMKPALMLSPAPTVSIGPVIVRAGTRTGSCSGVAIQIPSGPHVKNTGRPHWAASAASVASLGAHVPAERLSAFGDIGFQTHVLEQADPLPAVGEDPGLFRPLTDFDQALSYALGDDAAIRFAHLIENQQHVDGCMDSLEARRGLSSRHLQAAWSGS